MSFNKIQINVKEAAAFLGECDGTLIYCHASPDGDTIGSALALALVLRSLGKKAFAYSVEGIPEKLGFLKTQEVFLENEPEDLRDLTPISVDVASEKLLGNSKHSRFALSIDHHKVNTVNCERLLVMEDKIACGEIIYLLMEELGVELTKDIAEPIYTAICSDSGGFRYNATTAETYRMAASCIEAGIDFTEIYKQLFESKTPQQVALIKTAYNNLELLFDGKYAIVAISKEEAAECRASISDFECINPIPREIKGVLASAVIREHSDKVKISLRSNAEIDVAEIASRFGGGGHFHAAGLSLNCDFKTAVETARNIFAELEK